MKLLNLDFYLLMLIVCFPSALKAERTREEELLVQHNYTQSHLHHLISISLLSLCIYGCKKKYTEWYESCWGWNLPNPMQEIQTIVNASDCLWSLWLQWNNCYNTCTLGLTFLGDTAIIHHRQSDSHGVMNTNKMDHTFGNKVKFAGLTTLCTIKVRTNDNRIHKKNLLYY